MSTTIKRFARYIALPAVSAGIIAGAALGLAGAANAGTYSAPSPSIVATPDRIPKALGRRGWRTTPRLRMIPANSMRGRRLPIWP